MKKLILILLMSSFTIMAEETEFDPNLLPEKSISAPSGSNNVFYGGNINFSFWNKYFYIGLFPMIGYKITPELSAGLRLGYAYVTDGRFSPTLKSNNYGAGAFTRYNVIPEMYLKAEFIYFSFEKATNVTNSGYSTTRYGVPLLLLGAGYLHQVNANISVFFEVSFDVINDSNSPFKSGEPLFGIGMAVGL